MEVYSVQMLFDGAQFHQDMHLCIENGRIHDISPASISPFKSEFKLEGLVSAGFIDLQVNGGGGVLFNHDQSSESLYKIMHGHAQFGTTGMLPTLITDNNSTMSAAADAIAQAYEQHVSGILGIHFEGPHLSQPKRGIHSSSEVRPVSDDDLAIITRQDLGRVMVTVAPENLPTDVIKDLVSQGVNVSLGHSNADIDTVIAAIDAGAKCFTHLYNAMSGLSARAPGLIGAALTQPNVYAGIIADLHHVHPANLMLAYQSLGADRLMLVTDAMAHVGSNLQNLPWLDSTITRHDSKLTLDDNSLAGSCLDMQTAVKNMLRSIDSDFNSAEPFNSRCLGEVLNIASRTPAQFLGCDDRGVLVKGKRADFVLLDNTLTAKASWINGKQMFGRSYLN